MTWFPKNLGFLNSHNSPPWVIGCTWSPPRLSLPPCSHVADTDLNPKMEQWSYASYAIVIATYGNGTQRLHSPGVIPPVFVLPGYRPSDLWSHNRCGRVFWLKEVPQVWRVATKAFKGYATKTRNVPKLMYRWTYIIHDSWWNNVKCQSTWLKAAQSDNIVFSFVSSSLYHALLCIFFVVVVVFVLMRHQDAYFECVARCCPAYGWTAIDEISHPGRAVNPYWRIASSSSSRHARRYDTTSLTSGCRQWGQAGNMFGCKEASEASVYGYDCYCIIHVLRFAWLLLRMRNI